MLGFTFNNKVNAMTNEEILANEIKIFNGSEERQWMLIGDKYYDVDNDIKDRKILRSLPDGTYEEDQSKANNKLAHGFMKNFVDEKIAYLLTKDYSLKCDDDNAIEKVKNALGKNFGYTLSGLGYGASNKGKSWLQPYIDEKGQFKMMVIPAEQCCAIWKDNSHTELESMLRYYIIETYQGREKKDITKVEHWTTEGITYYILQDDKLILDSEKYLDGKEYSHFIKGGETRSWGKVPFICFKNNWRERPDIRFIKSLIDNYDKSRSDTGNFLEDIKNLIYVLKNYGGQDLAQFMKDLNYYRAVKVDDDGGVETLNPELDITAAKEHYEQLKRDIIEFGQGTNKDLDKFGSSPSGIALKFLYSGLDLKCNHMETEFKKGFQELMYFMKVYYAETGQGSFDVDVDIVFNRDVTINETETIDNCSASQGIISDETIVTNHPWVKDVEEELKKVTAEKKQKLKEQQEAFGMPVNNNGSEE